MANTPIETAGSLPELAENFVYTSEVKDRWTIMEYRSGKLYGDCDDYALTALYIIADKNMETFWKYLDAGTARIHFCYYHNRPHAVLEYRASYIDNIQKTWFSLDAFPAYTRDLKTKYYTSSRIRYKMGLSQLKKSKKLAVTSVLAILLALLALTALHL